MPSSPSEHPDTIRRSMFFSGRVQGVGFRYTTESIASRYAVTGFVRNLPDGRVEAVAEGMPAELDRFQCAVEQAMASNIRETAVTDGPANGEFTRFSLAF